MEASHTWFGPTESVYNPATTANVSSYFARPNKVVKSGSRNSSPRDMARRKTTTAATISSRARSVMDHLRCDSQAQQWQYSEASRPRPVSWHPACIEDPDITLNPSVNGQDLSGWNFSTTQVNGLFTPISYPATNEPQLEELFTPLDELPGPAMAPAYPSEGFGQHGWLNQNDIKSGPNSFDMYSQPSYFHPSWNSNYRPTPGEVQTAPSSPDFVPVSNLDLGTLSLDSTGDAENGEELVGMGLYDSPAEVQSSSLLFGEASSGRKVLKLEESFEPADQDEGEGRDDEDAQEEEDDSFQGAAASETAIGAPQIPDYSAQSVASHLGFGVQPEVDPIAYKYLATLSQLNSPYYPTACHSYGWI